MNKKLNVFFAIGEFFIQHFSVAITSLLETNNHLNLNVFLIYDFEDNRLLKDLMKKIELKYYVKLNLIFQDSSIFDKYRVANHVSKNTYLRLLLADVIPNDIDKGIFLDSDIVVTGSLEKLKALNFDANDDDIITSQSKYLYAVREIKIESELNSIRITKLGFPIDRYFNAGVMVINLKKWREDNLSAKLIGMTEEYMDSLLYWDQDVLNMYFHNQWGELDSTYNALHLIWKRKTVPLIIHYAGAVKPWHYLSIHPYKAVYVKYLKKTPFKDSRYTDFSYSKIPYKVFFDLKHFLNYFRQRYRGKLYE
jgi:lipopolysaccharide biosynthesis glycosyltransferase